MLADSLRLWDRGAASCFGIGQGLVIGRMVIRMASQPCPQSRAHQTLQVEAWHSDGREERLDPELGASIFIPGALGFVPVSRAQLSWEALQPRPRMH